MKTFFITGITVIALITGACTSSFLVYKDGKGCFVGSSSESKYNLLCTSGDLEKVLLASNLSQETKDSLYKYNCSAERSSEKVKQIFAAMTVAERKDIKNAFRANGYEINRMAC